MASLQTNIQKDVTCPICLELLTEPLSLLCGHSFCQACITEKNVESLTISPGGKRSCPVCHTPYQPGNLWPNQHLANIVKRFREVKLSSQKEQMNDLCVHHGEKLLFFCKNDEKIICCLCVRSQEHHGHQTLLVEEVTKECQEKLQKTLRRLRKEQQEAETLEAHITEEKNSWKHQTQAERQRILATFKDLHDILDNDKERELQKLEKEEVNVLDNLAAAKYQLEQQHEGLSKLISDVERWMGGSSLTMLQDMMDFMRRSEKWTLKKPKIISKKLKSDFRAPDLKEILRVFRELTDVQCYWVNVTLNPVNAPSNVVVSADKREVAVEHICSFRNSNQPDFSAFDVLGCQYFSSGKHYWEVDVSKKIAWILGVYCRMNNSSKRRPFLFAFGPNVNRQNIYARYRPRCGYWVIGLRDQFEYNAFEDSSSSDVRILTLSLAVPPHRVGVFLDYEAGTVSFFNVTNHGSLIYKYSQCCFCQSVYPYFNPCNCPAPMTLCPPNS